MNTMWQKLRYEFRLICSIPLQAHLAMLRLAAKLLIMRNRIIRFW